jgi:ribonuclease G
VSKEIIVNVGERETRIAVTEDGKLVEMHVERAERVVGSLYKCRVANVLPGMDASFVDIGLERNAFLYVGDVLPTGDDASTGEGDTGRKSADRRPRVGSDRRPNADTPIAAAIAPGISDDPASEETELEGGEDPLVDAADALQAAAEAELGLLDDEEEEPEAGGETDAEGGKSAAPRRNFRRSALRQQRIKDVLKVGQELLVQVIKGPRSTKGARVSTRISMPGRYLVLMPEGDNLGVSRKIEDPKERDRLKKIGDRLREPGFGMIIRTEAEEKTEQELRGDWDFLMQNWRQVVEKAKKVSAPALIQQDLTLLYKTIRDVFGSDVSKLVIDEPAEYEKANELLERISPNLRGRVHLYDGPMPIFDHFKIEQEMDRLLRRKVFLKTGGSLVIDETEALTVIDVNTSKFTGGGSLQETIVKTNLDAAGEIARQLRLRDIGGIIVIDFIDMNTARDKQAVLKTLEAVLKKDRSRTKISSVSALGLVEMTRKRTGETLTGFMTDECPYCKGRGHLPSAESVSLVIERDLRRQIGDPKNARREAFLINCHPDVAELVIGPEGTNIAWLEQQLQRALYVRCDLNAHIEKYSIEGGEIIDLDKTRLGFRRAQIVECRVVRSLLKEPNKCIGWADGYLLDLDDGYKMVGQKAKVRITDVRRSYATASVIPGSNRPLE